MRDPEARSRAFRRRQHARMLPVLRVGLVAGAALFPAMVIWDLFIAKRGTELLPLRLLLGLPLVLLDVATLLRPVARRPGLILLVAVLLSAAGIDVISNRLPEGQNFQLPALTLVALVIGLVGTTLPLVVAACAILAVVTNLLMIASGAPGAAILSVDMFLIPASLVVAFLGRVNERADRRAFDLEQALEAERARQSELARTDPLTGVHNRRSWFERASEALALAARGNRPLSVLILDIDRFKAINDTHGHHAGDDTLRTVSATCAAALRATDSFGRIGGEEFAALLPDTDAAGAEILAERLRAAVETAPIRIGAAVPCTISIGVATRNAEEVSPADASELEALLGMADSAMYEAKRAGRNRVATADSHAA